MSHNKKITHEVFNNLLYLSRLSANDSDTEMIAEQVSRIVDYFDILKKYDVPLQENNTADYTERVVRSDTVVEGIPPSDLKQMSSEYMDGYFRVPKVLGSGV